ncbi:hypothetical protein BUALT_Bualt16G0071900 [Buddleja alternifolia]|uniref:MULE transposase domain-containing protein n=1 Tax=Buddleja alternifolia TaxID=168488 RepID=A0AAV6WKE8_9LAMI|nr:hypothetical protein BUALT_Bualt16G0071900 [Buddleja alternifolia]
MGDDMEDSRSDFDDSSDSDYVQPEHLESGDDEEDGLLNEEEMEGAEPAAVGDDEVINLDGSDDENGDRRGNRQEYFKEGDWNMKGKNLVDNTIFQIKSQTGQHTCARTFDNKLAKTSYIAKRIENLIKNNPFVSSETLVNTVHMKCGVELSRAKVARAKKEAIEKIAGFDSKEYALLWDYCETVRAKNPGSLILLRKQDRVEPPIFDKMYYSLAAMRIGFLAGCRLIIAMKIENYENWKWFVSVLLEDLGGLECAHKWCFISDRQKWLIEAMSELTPHSEHSANKPDFEMWMQNIDRADPKVDINEKTASEWLREIPFQHWCMAYFQTTCKSDVLVNNLCDSFNSYILSAKAIGERRTKTEDYVDDSYSKQAYLKVYENMIHDVPGQRYYIKITFQALRAPPMKMKRGRPRKNRIRVPSENLNITKAGLTHNCQIFLQLGHNKASCTNPSHPASKCYKGPVAAEAQPSDAPQHASQPVGADAPQPTQTSQDDPVAQPVPRPQGRSPNVPTGSGSNARGRVHIGADISAIPTGRSSGAVTSQGTTFGNTTTAPNPPPRKVEATNNYSAASNIAPETVQK